MDTVSLGKHNPRLADIRKAIDQGTLTSDGLLPIEGPRLIREAEASGLHIAALFIRPDAEVPGIDSETPVYTLEPAVFKSIQDTETSQGVVALVRPRTFAVADVVSRIETCNPIVVLAGLQDPGNVGTILRVAESLGAAGCIALPNTASVYNPKTVRASSGSIFRLPHAWNVRLEDVAETLHASEVRLVGTSPRATVSIGQWDWLTPTAVLIGNEGNGLDDSQTALCETLLRVPQQPEVESLNSAIAAAIVLYEAFRCRGSV